MSEIYALQLPARQAEKERNKKDDPSNFSLNTQSLDFQMKDRSKILSLNVQSRNSLQNVTIELYILKFKKLIHSSLKIKKTLKNGPNMKKREKQ